MAQTGDYIVAVVNQELVTAGELQQRLARVRDDAARNRTPLPPPAVLRKQVLDTLIDERVLVTNARDSGARVDEPELDRAVANVATQNQLTMPQLRERLRKEGHRLREVPRQHQRPDAGRAGARARGRRAGSRSATPRSTT